MSALERLLVAVIVLIVLAVGSAIYLEHYGAGRYKAGYDDAVAAGKEMRDVQATAALAIESGLRTQLADKDAAAFTQEQQHAQALEDAQRRVRTGADSLRCPATSPVQPAAAPDDRSLAAAPTADGQGPAIVPETAADLLGIASDVAGLVRRYGEVIERFDACRKVNAGP